MEADAPKHCRHYRRGCRVLAPCCSVWVPCRLCHNELFPDHEIDRHAIRQMQCLSCNTAQPCARECSKCAAVMGDYFCSVCNLFDDDGAQKQIFHCDDCGICRVGGRENFYHCATCCGCYPHSLNNRHRCVDGSMHRECAICLERTFDSLQTVNVMVCGHVLHHSCYREYVRYGNVVCPTCRTSLVPQSEQQGLQGRGGTGGGDESSTGDEDDDDESDLSDVDSEHMADGQLILEQWEVASSDNEGENDVEGLEDSEEEVERR